MKEFNQLATENKLTLNYGKKTVYCNSIKYIESFAGNYSMIRLADANYICSAFTLKHYTSQLEGENNFFLARKGLLLNLAYLSAVKELDGVKCVQLSTGEIFKLSRRLGSKLLDYLNIN
jgi:hypothetical protein